MALFGRSMMGRAEDGETYLDLLVAQGFTNYWSLQTQRNSGATEPDLIGSGGAQDMDMAGGDTVNNTSGPLGASDGSNAQTFVTNDTEGFRAVDSTTYSVNNDWSMSGWWKLTVQTGTANILWSWLDFDSNNNLYLIRRDDRSGLTIQIGDGAAGGGSNFFDFGVEIENDGDWHHIAATRDYSATNTLDVWTIYLDGAQTDQKTRAVIGAIDIPNSIGRWAIANRSAINLGMDGSVAHVAFAQGVVISSGDVADQWDYRNF